MCTIGSTVSYDEKKSSYDGFDCVAFAYRGWSVAGIEPATAEAPERTTRRVRLLRPGAVVVAGVLPRPSGEAGV